MIDRLGNEIEIGDTVCFVKHYTTSSHLDVGIVSKNTGKSIEVCVSANYGGRFANIKHKVVSTQSKVVVIKKHNDVKE